MVTIFQLLSLSVLAPTTLIKRKWLAWRIECITRLLDVSYFLENQERREQRRLQHKQAELRSELNSIIGK